MELSVVTRLAYQDLVDLPESVLLTYLDVLDDQARERRRAARRG